MNSNEPNLKIKLSVFGFLFFLVLTGIAMFIAKNYFNAEYGSVQMILAILPAELIVIVGLFGLVNWKFGWKEIGFKVPTQKSLVWILPLYIVLFAGWVLFILNIKNLNINPEQWGNFWIIGLVTMLVGIAEETMFRGVLLHALAEKMSARRAVIYSAIAFSLLHSINIISGVPIAGMAIQLVLTFIAGFYLGAVMLKIKSIIPLIIWHWFWDFLTVGTSQINFTQNSIVMIALIVVELVFGIIIWEKLKSEDKISTSKI